MVQGLEMPGTAWYRRLEWAQVGVEAECAKGGR